MQKESEKFFSRMHSLENCRVSQKNFSGDGPKREFSSLDSTTSLTQWVKITKKVSFLNIIETKSMMILIWSENSITKRKMNSENWKWDISGDFHPLCMYLLWADVVFHPEVLTYSFEVFPPTPFLFVQIQSIVLHLPCVHELIVSNVCNLHWSPRNTLFLRIYQRWLNCIPPAVDRKLTRCNAMYYLLRLVKSYASLYVFIASGPFIISTHWQTDRPFIIVFRYLSLWAIACKANCASDSREYNPRLFCFSLLSRSFFFLVFFLRTLTPRSFMESLWETRPLAHHLESFWPLSKVISSP